MKKFLFCFFCLLGLSSTLKSQTVTLLIDAGLLENATGTAAVPAGGLLQLIASSSGTFTAPTSSSYVGGDSTNFVVASFAMNYSSGTTGETVNGINNMALTASFAAGDKLLLRFFPNLTLASMPSAPTLATTYGQVRSDTIEFGPAGGDPTETAWVVPPSGSAHLDYNTVSDGGTYANTTAYATGIVLVPEPSTTGVIGGLAVLFAVWTKLRSRRSC